jgi:hypothetical protein
MTDIPALVGELVYLTGITEAARYYMKEGQMLDLASVNERCTTLCTKLQTVTGPEHDTLQATLISLVSTLNLLQAELKSSRTNAAGRWYFPIQHTPIKTAVDAPPKRFERH